MNIENYVAEIQGRKKREIESLDIRLAEEKTAIQFKKDNAIKEIQEYYTNNARLKSEREAARIVEAARLQAKKILFDAINLNLDSAFVIIKEKLRSYAQSADYKRALQKMVMNAKKHLGPNINIICREQDRSALTDMGVKVTKTIQTIGGVIAENENGSKELDLTFEELLRIHEDEVKSSILEELV
ncbi:MAG TPA: V-type ATP synthase subunit E [Candidatus Eisenbacteria bacterium]|nr:V-type ATP synthase subunit E [Candidatus Eisenbacteria bacterium]